MLRAHLNAAYSEIGQLKVKLLEAALGSQGCAEETNFQFKAKRESRCYQTPKDQKCSSLREYMQPSSLDDDLVMFLESSESAVRNLEHEWALD